MKPVLGLFLLLLTPSAQAFTLMLSSNSNMYGWASSNVKLDVNTANCPAGIDVPGIISEAAEVWNNVPTSNVKVSYGTSTTSTTYGNPTTVYCDTNFPGDQDSIPGAASIQTIGGVISGGALILNASSGAANIATFDREKLLIILAHEIGHILGLGHSGDSTALMYYDATLKTSLGLAQDDMDGMSYLYPKDELSGDPIMGCGLVKQNPPTNGSTMWWACLALLLPLLIYSKLRFKLSQTRS
ncbi:matrixin family metalloprotease [Bdellovibrio reynosensis]|uniref:M10 family metallopeptidase domain-containing protein n=1 Tax=Bdellovibrio reynosensis TaxID=2835041 RepID=A0ABY4CGH5_9BACT|nr:matrixin family metalloprotease [Bdellovibrio reynosensis]UOF02668.1 M10 family metallopeptidase domain-containing protein [Bdellovibrio reynosensis]